MRLAEPQIRTGSAEPLRELTDVEVNVNNVLKSSAYANVQEKETVIEKKKKQEAPAISAH